MNDDLEESGKKNSVIESFTGSFGPNSGTPKFKGNISDSTEEQARRISQMVSAKKVSKEMKKKQKVQFDDDQIQEVEEENLEWGFIQSQTERSLSHAQSLTKSQKKIDLLTIIESEENSPNSKNNIDSNEEDPRKIKINTNESSLGTDSSSLEEEDERKDQGEKQIPNIKMNSSQLRLDKKQQSKRQTSASEKNLMFNKMKTSLFFNTNKNENELKVKPQMRKFDDKKEKDIVHKKIQKDKEETMKKFLDLFENENEAKDRKMSINVKIPDKNQRKSIAQIMGLAQSTKSSRNLISSSKKVDFNFKGQAEEQIKLPLQTQETEEFFMPQQDDTIQHQMKQLNSTRQGSIKNQKKKNVIQKQLNVAKLLETAEIKEGDIEKEIHRQEAKSEEVEQNTYDSNRYNLFNLFGSALFLIIVITEVDFSSQQQIGSIYKDLFNDYPYNENLDTRIDIQNPSQIYEYFSNFFIPVIYSEPTKAVNGYFNNINNYQYLQSLQNKRDHFINNFNYFAGFRLTYRRLKWNNNTDVHSRTVMPNRLTDIFVSHKIFDEQTQDLIKIYTNGQNKTYQWKPADGMLETGAYTDIFLGNMTYEEAKTQLEDLKDAGWFQDEFMLFFSCEALFFNMNYRHGSFFIFQFSRQVTGLLQDKQSFVQTLYPCTYEDLSQPKAIVRLIVVVVYTFCLAVNSIRMLSRIITYLRILFETKRLEITWQDYIEIPIIILNSKALFHWYINFSERNNFGLPLINANDFIRLTIYQKQIRYFIQYSPWTIICLCLKNLQILAAYLPSFGVLFETIFQSKNKAFSFFIMSLILLIGFIVSGNIWFGFQLGDYSTIGNSAMMIFQILMNQSSYEDLSNSNPDAAPLFYFPAQVFFYLVMLNMFLTIIINIYNDIRQRKQLESEAIARIFLKEYQWNIFKWYNLLMCRINRKTKDQFIKQTQNPNHNHMDDDNDDEDAYGDQGSRQDLTTICLFNKVQSRGSAEAIKRFIEGSDISINDQNFQDTYNIKLVVDNIMSNNDTNKETKDFLKNIPLTPQIQNDLYDITSLAEIQQWIIFKVYENLYYDKDGQKKFLYQNNFVGEGRIRITFRKLKSFKSNYTNTNETYSYVRHTTILDPQSDVYEDEETEAQIGAETKRSYNYTEEGTLQSYNKKGGYVMRLNQNKSLVYKQLDYLYRDRILNENFGSMVLEIVTYNPNYKMYILSKIVFQYANTGLILPYHQSKAFRVKIYSGTKDYLRALLEIIFVLYNLRQNYKILINFRIKWQVQREKDVKALGLSHFQDKDLFMKFCRYIGMSYHRYIKKRFIILLAAIVYHFIKMIFRIILRAVKVSWNLVTETAFSILNIFSTGISNYLIYLWIHIIYYSAFNYEENGYTKDGELTHVDVISYIAVLYVKYQVFCALNSIMIFWRIFEFFKFSPKLSVFTEILKSSKNDILYFLIMFLIVILGFAIMGFLNYGENLEEFSDLLSSFIELFQMMAFYFDYEALKDYSDLSIAFFVPFMIISTMFLLNMLVAIIIAHYEQYEITQSQIQRLTSDDQNDQGFFSILFTVIRLSLAPDRLQQSKKLCLRNYYAQMKKIEEYFYTKPVTDTKDQIEEEILQLQQLLTEKFEQPKYEKKDHHKFINKYFEDGEVDDNKNDNKNLMQTEQAINYKEIQLGVLGELQNATLEEKTSAAIWAAAIENEVFKMTNKTIFYTDFLQQGDTFKKEEFCKIYDPKKFSTKPVQFLLENNRVKQFQLWKESNIQQKYKIWQILDFKKTFDDQESIEQEEKLEQYFDFLLKIKREKGKQYVAGATSVLDIQPLLSFKKINKSPEFQHTEYSRSSELQVLLWNKHTTKEEQYILWFKIFDSYYRTKLWNALTFSEEYVANIVNSSSTTRIDLQLYLVEALIQIRTEYLGFLDEQKVKLDQQKQRITLRTKESQWYPFTLKYNAKLSQIDEIKKRKINLQTVVKKAYFSIRRKYLSSEFYLKVWQILKQRKYYKEEIIFNDDEKIKNIETQIQKSIIDQVDIENQNQVQSNYNPVKQKKPKIIVDNKSSPKLRKKSQKALIKQFSIKKVAKKNIDSQSSPSIKRQSEKKLFNLYPTHQSPIKTQIESVQPTTQITQETKETRVETRSSLVDPSDPQNMKIQKSEQVLYSELRKFPGAKVSKEVLMKQINSKFRKIMQINRAVRKNEIKVTKKDLIYTQKSYFKLMLHGLDGKQMKKMNNKVKQRFQDYEEDGKYLDDEFKNDISQETKYNYLCKVFDSNEQRLQLWIPLTLEQKVKMMACQHVEDEAEQMSMLLLEEIDWSSRGQSTLEEIEIMMERALDNMIYNKYQLLTEYQALTCSNLKLDQALQVQLEQDVVLFQYMDFLKDKAKYFSETLKLQTRTIQRQGQFNSRMKENMKEEKERRIQKLQKQNSKLMMNIQDFNEQFISKSKTVNPHAAGSDLLATPTDNTVSPAEIVRSNTQISESVQPTPKSFQLSENY